MFVFGLLDVARRVHTFDGRVYNKACGQPEGGSAKGVAGVEAAYVEECVGPPGRWS
jgi:hypothetical protein